MVFAVAEGKIMGFFVSKDGIIIDPDRSEAITKIGLPISKISMQSFTGKINLVRRFVPNFAQIFRPLQDMINNYDVFKSSGIQNDVFTNIKKAIMDAPTLMPPGFSKDFILYTFDTDVFYVAMLTQKNVEDVEILVSFICSTFKKADLNYT